MFESNEAILFFAAVTTFLFLLSYARNTSNRHDLTLLKVALGLQVTAWFFTNLENVFWPMGSNLIEHLCDFFSTAFLVVWLWRAGRSKEAAS